MSKWVDQTTLNLSEQRLVASIDASVPQILEALSQHEPEQCPRCGGRQWASDGTAQRRSGRVRVFRCTACGKKITEGGQGPFRHPVFEPGVMVTAVLLRDAGWTQVRLAEVLRASADTGARRPNRQTISRWTRRLTSLVLEVCPEQEKPAVSSPEAEVVLEAPASGLPKNIGSRFSLVRLLVDESDRLIAVVHDLWSDDEPEVVIKVLPLGQKDEVRGEFEVRSRLRHPHLAPVLDVGDVTGLSGVQLHAPSGGWWFTQELVSGDDLYESSRDAEPVQLCEWLVQSLRVLAWLHERGIIHRDIKPANILVGETGLQLVDFGIAFVQGSQDSRHHRSVGSPAYMAPELTAGSTPTEQSDLYSLGITFEHIVNRSLDSVSTRTDLPVWFLRFLQRLSHPDPAMRPSSAVVALDILSSHAGTTFAAETADTVLARLRTGWQRVRVAQMASINVGVDMGSHVLLTGPSGIGRTSVLERWRHGYQLDGGILLPGTASSLLRAAVYRLGTGHALVKSQSLAVERLIGRASDIPVDALKPTDAILSDRDTILSLLETAFSEPCVVLADDIDALDPLSFGVIEALVQGAIPNLHVVGASQSPLRRHTDTIRAWLETGLVSQVTLPPWTAEELTTALDEAFSDRSMAEGLSNRLLEVTEGNPRFVEELLGALVERGALRREGEKWHVDHVESLPVPGELVAACRSRIDKLAANERRVLDWLSLTEQPVPEATFVRLSSFEPLEELRDKRLVRDEPGGVVLAHIGVRAALDAVEPEAAIRSAEALGTALESSHLEGQRPDELLGCLWERANQPGRAYPYVLSAFRASRLHWDSESTIRLGRQLEHLLESSSMPSEPMDNEDFEEVLRGMIQALRLAGLHDEVAVALDRLSLLGQVRGDPRITCDAAALKALHWFGQQRLDLARQLAEGHLKVARGLEDLLVAARLLWILAMIARQTGRVDDGLELSEQSLSRISHLNSLAAIELRVQCLINLGNSYGQTGQLDRALGAFERAGEHARQAGLVSSRIVCTMNLGICWALQGRYRLSLEHFQRAGREAARLGWGETRDILDANQAEVECHLGHFESASKRAAHLLTRGDVASHVMYAARLAFVDASISLGESVEAARVLKEARSTGPVTARLECLQARLEMLGGQQGAINRAIAHLKTAAKLGAPHEAAIAHARNALLELQSGHPEQAREALSRAQDCSDAGAPEIREGTIEVCWARYRVLAELGDAANAKSALRDATNYLARIISELDAADRESALTRWPNREVAEAAVHVLGTQYEYLGARRADMSVVAASLERFAGGQPNLTSLESLLVDLLALTRGSRIGLAIWKDGLITWPVFRTSGGALVTPNEAIESFTRLVCQSGVEHFEPEKEEATQVGWPLSYGGEVLGAIIVDSHEAFSWTADIQFALRSLVATAALATKVRAQSIELESVQEQVVRELTRTQERLRSETSRRERAERAVEAERHNIRLAHNYDQIIHRSRVMAELLSQLDRLVDRKATVLVVGESGTGKELIARALHHHGVRASGPFVALNCGAVPESLIESELFGHVKGAFTGAHRDRVGQFELANKGTLFLDEIGEIAPAMQVRLLRVLETGAVTKVGSSREVPTDTRIVAATNRDLAAEVEAGRFRQDLFYRLNVVMLRVPPLRERPEDIEPLIHHFAEALAVKNGERAVTFDSLFIERLMGHHWPGNVRELRNVVEYATLFAEDGRVPSDLSLPFKPKM